MAPQRRLHFLFSQVAPARTTLRPQELEQLRKSIEGLLLAERDRRMAARARRGEQVYRWGYTLRKCWQTLWGELRQVRVPRLRGREEIGLIQKYQRQGRDEGLLGLAAGGGPSAGA